MSNPFSAAIRGIRTKVTKALDVSDLLLGDLLDREVISQVQYDEILVRCLLCLMFTARTHRFYASRDKAKVKSKPVSNSIRRQSCECDEINISEISASFKVRILQSAVVGSMYDMAFKRQSICSVKSS